MLKVAIGISAFLLPLVACLVEADPLNDLSRQYAVAARNTWEREIEPKFLAAMSPSEKELEQKIDFEFPPGGGSYDAFATMGNDGRKVLIAGGFVVGQDLAIDAFVTANHFGLMGRYQDYLQFASNKGLENAALVRAGEALVPVPRFATYAHVDPASASAFFRSDLYDSQMQIFRVNSLAIVLAHEIAHHLHNDVVARHSDDDQRQREAAADHYAIELTIKAGFSPLATIPLMMLFNEGGGDTRHPPPMCRVVSFVANGAIPILNSPDFRRYEAEHPDDRGKIAKFAEFLKTHHDEISRDCGKWINIPS